MELNEIENVRGWMEAKHPAEPQTGEIPDWLTFSWLRANLRNREEWEPLLVALDTSPRERILMEAVRRMALDLRDAGIVRQAVVDTVMATPDWR